ncbi:MAG TPA: hypothetical protein VGM72_10005 [Micropepsaceae bacterium]|jgi:hypothetical protein
MRAYCILVTAVLCAGGTLAAEGGWQLFSYPESGFAAQYPNPPQVETVDYKTAQTPDGIVKQRVYSTNNGGVIYSVAVADFTRTRAEKDKTIEEAVANLSGLGKLTHNESGARIDGNYGREIRVEDATGTSYTDAIFFIDNKLYELKVTYPAVNNDPIGSSGIHFFQQTFQLLH